MQTVPESVSTTETAAEVQRRLIRSNRDRMFAGVAGGLGEYFELDPIWFRIGFVVLALGGGSGVLIYLIMWLVIPRAPEGYVASGAARGTLTGAAVTGVVFVIAGSVALVNTLSPSLGQYVWPVVLLLGGLALVLGGLRRDTHG